MRVREGKGGVMVGVGVSLMARVGFGVEWDY